MCCGTSALHLGTGTVEMLAKTAPARNRPLRYWHPVIQTDGLAGLRD